MKAKMIFTDIVREKLVELEITTSKVKGDKELIIIDGKTYWFITPVEFAEKKIQFLEQRDLLKMTPEIKIGDYVQIHLETSGFTVREVVEIVRKSIIIKENKTNKISYGGQYVKRVPTYLVSLLRDGGFIDD